MLSLRPNNNQPIDAAADRYFILQKQLFETLPDEQIHLEDFQIINGYINGKGKDQSRNTEYQIEGVLKGEMADDDRILNEEQRLVNLQYDDKPLGRLNIRQQRHHHIELRNPAPPDILLTIKELPCLCKETKIQKVQNQPGSNLKTVECRKCRVHQSNLQIILQELREINIINVKRLFQIQMGESIKDTTVFQDLIQLIIAKYLSQKFNKVIKDTGFSLKYLDTYLLVPHFNNTEQQFYQVELFQEGEMEKYNMQIEDFSNRKNNQQFNGKEAIGKELQYQKLQEFYQLASAFSHWTQSITDKMMTIVDVQGWRIANSLILTDPLIHSYIEGMFGKVDISLEGQKQWLQDHDCENNKFCKYLGLEKSINKNNIQIQFELSQLLTQFKDNQKIFQNQFKSMVTEIYNDDNFEKSKDDVAQKSTQIEQNLWPYQTNGEEQKKQFLENYNKNQ
ncbi:mhck ef2 kinase domain family protein [Stylonychia lemnae]|uniref:Mhck ef2 kinase domain family protein n=1 Tax=Stylonychia lemnae TaxID=5949 RepID=A0A077ZS67_STYLE|nr:mhck ef2 kinase domain family protein [Stylonychia lemnae]|eukprot:CDW72344.1 mhck ef2 kinase domain family protein [Stylonychia lemnae]